ENPHHLNAKQEGAVQRRPFSGDDIPRFLSIRPIQRKLHSPEYAPRVREMVTAGGPVCDGASQFCLGGSWIVPGVTGYSRRKNLQVRQRIKIATGACVLNERRKTCEVVPQLAFVIHALEQEHARDL